MMNNGTHVLDLIHYLNGDRPAEWVMGQIDCRSRKKGQANHPDMVMEDAGIGEIRYANGLRATVELGAFAPQAYQFHLIGSDGVIDVNVPGGPPLRLLSSQGSGWEIPDIQQPVNATVLKIVEFVKAVARGPIAASPMHLILHELVAMDRFFYLYADEREAMSRLCERMAPFFEACLDALVSCDAEVVFWGANYDQDLTWPPFFEAEIAPWLRRVGDRLHAAGKYPLTHADGENQALLPLYPVCGFDVAESVCPAPMTRCTLTEIRAGMGPKTTVFGGIPSVSLLPDSMDDATFEAYIDDLFGSLGAGDRLILGVSDNVPPDADLSRMERIVERIEAFGPVRLRGTD